MSEVYDQERDLQEESLRCLEASDARGCRGGVELRPALSPTGRWFPRCDRHWHARLREQNRLAQAYGVQRDYT